MTIATATWQRQISNIMKVWIEGIFEFKSVGLPRSANRQFTQTNRPSNYQTQWLENSSSIIRSLLSCLLKSVGIQLVHSSKSSRVNVINLLYSDRLLDTLSVNTKPFVIRLNNVSTPQTGLRTVYYVSMLRLQYVTQYDHWSRRNSYASTVHFTLEKSSSNKLVFLENGKFSWPKRVRWFKSIILPTVCEPVNLNCTSDNHKSCCGPMHEYVPFY